ncbi:MAG: sodium:solute symporter family protein [Rickettsia endosymbiont of Labidopullus appendiculatus]|nr:sodium:solute symporter family protein [Rickettsia endosymbiont of Labidopullus appendiculatus]
MNFDIDLAIITAFLVVNICSGIYYGRGIKTIKEYAIGNRNFSTGTIATTLIATWAGGGIFSIVISKTYTDGFYSLIPFISNVVSFLIVAYFFAPRMAEFLGQLSVAEVMGNLYGKTTRTITAIAGLFCVIGVVAIQFKVLSTTLSYFFAINNLIAVLISSSIVIIYSTFGGIKAVTFTDIIQFFTFGTFIPILALTIWGSFDNSTIVFEVIKQNHIFNLNEIFNYHNPKFWALLALCLHFSLPGFDPVFFQRVLMAKNTQQIYKSFNIAGFCSLLIILLLGWISILIFSSKQGLDPNSIYSYIIDNYAYVGLKGFIIVGIMAMIMSTADSYINTSAVLFAHDFCKPFNIKWVERNELLLSRICSLVIGIVAIFLALSTQDLLELVLFKASFYVPIVSVPLMLTIFGFRSTEKSVLIAMSAGVITVIIWRVFLSHTGINTVIPGMIANLIFLLASHYLLKQPGGWG